MENIQTPDAEARRPLDLDLAIDLDLAVPDDGQDGAEVDDPLPVGGDGDFTDGQVGRPRL